MPDLLPALIAFAAAFAAGVINSVAGGGTLVTFPVLVWLGVPSIVANATNAVSMTPGSLSSAWGYRREIGSSQRLLMLVAPSLAGGIVGALLLKLTPPGVFDRLVPFLILFATVLFMAQQQVQRLLKTQAAMDHSSSRWLVGAIIFQFFVSLYGGYFGAGMGILMLAALSIIGLTDIHQMNGWKNVFGTCINGIAAVYFVLSGMVSWPYAIVMTVGSIVGGASGAGLARRMGRDMVRRIVIVIGLGMALSLFFKR
ncbi:MAG: sulfite exporter TauE/SafE family protein [Acidobacteria bacterium]|nr:sulfite exporter TauE/SafE family protein [Acidobacteriota bacterium]